MSKVDSATRQRILGAALKHFAHHGYAGASVQAIVDTAKVTKPTLYYYFGNKSALCKALVDSAHEERYRIIEEGMSRGETFEEKLVEILAAMFSFLKDNRELMRLAFCTAFAAPGEFPEGVNSVEKSVRNVELIHSLIKKEMTSKHLDDYFKSRELAYGFFGLMNVYVMSHLVVPDFPLSRQTAENMVRLFLNGAAKK